VVVSGCRRKRSRVESLCEVCCHGHIDIIFDSEASKLVSRANFGTSKWNVFRRLAGVRWNLPALKGES
jgi:hypothetical protein